MLRIDITDEDIAFGLPRDPYNCPLARAITRTTGLHALVDRFLITVGMTHYETPGLFKWFIDSYDSNSRVFPISCILKEVRY
jgi:phosphoglucomutase